MGTCDSGLTNGGLGTHMQINHISNQLYSHGDETAGRIKGHRQTLGGRFRWRDFAAVEFPIAMIIT